jgi:hypothetical protein
MEVPTQISTDLLMEKGPLSSLECIKIKGLLQDTQVSNVIPQTAGIKIILHSSWVSIIKPDKMQILHLHTTFSSIPVTKYTLEMNQIWSLTKELTPAQIVQAHTTKPSEASTPQAISATTLLIQFQGVKLRSTLSLDSE